MSFTFVFIFMEKKYEIHHSSSYRMYLNNVKMYGIPLT